MLSSALGRGTGPVKLEVRKLRVITCLTVGLTLIATPAYLLHTEQAQERLDRKLLDAICQ
jgi:hypothetical protein